MSIFKNSFWGLALALALPALYFLVFIPDEPFHPTAIVLGEEGYDPRQLTAPVATGPVLEVIAYLLTATRAGPFLRRSVLNANGFDSLRTLAQQVTGPPLYFPMRRLSTAQFTSISEEAEESTPLLETALKDETLQLEVGFRTVTDFAKQYAAGLQVNEIT